MVKTRLVYNNKIYNFNKPNIDNEIVDLLNDLDIDHVKFIFENKPQCDCITKTNVKQIMEILAFDETFTFVKYDQFAVCDYCGGKAVKRIGGVDICEICLEDKTEVCSVCKERHLKDDIIHNVYAPTGKLIENLCSRCKERLQFYVFRCRHCNKYYAEYMNRTAPLATQARQFCQECREHYYYFSECGHIVPIDSVTEEEKARSKCKCCIEREKKQKALHSYGHKPIPVFKNAENENKTKVYHMGIELETELKSGTGNNTYDLAYEGTKNAEDFVYAKTDGSLSNGVEFVTHPISFKAWIDTYLDRLNNDVLTPIKENIGVQENPSSAGIHIHLSRDSLGRNAQERNEVITRICYLLSTENNYNLLTKFCNRSKEKIKRWASNYDTYEYGNNNLEERPLKDRVYISHNRYKVVNLCNQKTVEFRCFGSSVDIRDIQAYLVFVYSVVEYCKNHTDQDILDTDLKTVLTYRYPKFMKEYCTEKGVL